MRAGPSSAVLAGAARWSCSVSAWKGTTLLAESVPVAGGRLTADVTQEVPERLTFTVPDYADGYSWVPDTADHPLAACGQFVEVDIHVWRSLTPDPDSPPTSTTRLGRFQIQSWDHDEDGFTVQVECVGLLQKALDARFRTPQVPRSAGTLASEFRRLMVPGIPVEVSDSLVDRAVPQSFQWDEDRLGALYEIADAWPARLRVDQFGVLQVLPPLPDEPVPVVWLTDGHRGTLISAPREGSRDGVYNVVVARSTMTDSPAKEPLQAVREVGYGPLMPSEYGEVTFFWSSPLAATWTALDQSAATILADKIRPARVRVVRCAPDPRIELGDGVQLRQGTRETRGFVVATDLPLTVDGGDMSVTVGVA